MVFKLNVRVQTVFATFEWLATFNSSSVAYIRLFIHFVTSLNLSKGVTSSEDVTRCGPHPLPPYDATETAYTCIKLSI